MLRTVPNLYLSRPSSLMIVSTLLRFCFQLRWLGSLRKAANVKVSSTVNCGNSISSWVTNPILLTLDKQIYVKLHYFIHKTQNCNFIQILKVSIRFFSVKKDKQESHTFPRNIFTDLLLRAGVYGMSLKVIVPVALSLNLPPMTFNKVVFPLPEGPIKARISPEPTLPVIPFRTCL